MNGRTQSCRMPMARPTSAGGGGLVAAVVLSAGVVVGALPTKFGSPARPEQIRVAALAAVVTPAAHRLRAAAPSWQQDARRGS